MDGDRDVPECVWRTIKATIKEITNGIIDGVL